METIHAKNVVVGAGAMGSSAAYHLARRGEPVLLIEQFALGHDRGSSHGAARIARHSYADVRYARLMPDAFRAWRTLEADAGQNVYLRCGGLSLCPEGVDYVGQVVASLEDVGVPYRRLTGREVRKRFPTFGPPEHSDAVFEPDAGLIAAAKAVRLQVELARSLGGESTRVIENAPVRRIDLDGDKPVLITDRARVVADRLVVTAGAWTHRLTPDWPVVLRPTRQQVLYFRPADPREFVPGPFPVFIVMGGGPLNDFYGMPYTEGLGVKVARHGGPDTDPDESDPLIGEEYRHTVRQFLRTWLPGLAEAPIGLTEICLYTVTPSEHFQIGPLPGRPDVIVASPCSGHGFKFSCLIGRMLADLATTGETELAIDPWRLPATSAFAQS